MVTATVPVRSADHDDLWHRQRQSHASGTTRVHGIAGVDGMQAFRLAMQLQSSRFDCLRDSAAAPSRSSAATTCSAPESGRAEIGSRAGLSHSGPSTSSEARAFAKTPPAFRVSPASFARFIGDFRNAALNAS